ncbi:MAG: S9 family peptidase [Candidatus Heimdallarchaeota archaeon]
MGSQKELFPPVAKIVPKRISIHGEELIDNYYWLREKDNPEVIDYLKAENDYTEDQMKETESLQNLLYEEIRSRLKEDDVSAREIAGEYCYYTRTEKGKQYKQYFRKKIDINEPEELLLDLNVLATGQPFLKLGVFRISPNHELLAYSIDIAGSEEYTLCIKDLKSGELLEERIPKTYDGVEWANDKTIFYNILNDQKRPFELYRHTLRTNPKNDQLVYREDNEAFFLDIHKSRDFSYLFMTLKSNTTTEVHYLATDRPEGKLSVIHPRQHKMEYYVDHQQNHFIIRTNDDALNFKLMKVPVDQPSKENWEELVPHRDSVLLTFFEVFANHLVLHEREEGLKKVHVINLNTNEEHDVKFPEKVYTCWKPPRYELLIHPEYQTNLLRINYSSLITPNSVFEHNMDTHERTLLKQDEVLGSYDPSDYETQRISAKASDDETIYISLVYKKGLEKNGKNPLLLYGYGSYGYSIDPTFRAARISLLDRGVIFALAHIRGGSELGRKWYENGKLLQKKNTFTDFIACAEYLIAEKYTSSESLAIMGGSAGGLLMGAVVNMQPDLFNTVVALVPFVDVINSMNDPSIPLTVVEFEEWGNPQDKQFYDYMKSYSPYDNVEAKDYPHMLVAAGLNDPRVQYWEPAKWTAKLRATKTDSNHLFLKTHMAEGHSGKSGRYDAIKETAFYYAFIIDSLGLTER